MLLKQLIHNRYDGPWFDRSTGYIPYPMGFVLREYGGKLFAFLSFSQLEKKGFIAKIDVDELLSSMIPINCSHANAVS